jgi:hypothetical protein
MTFADNLPIILSISPTQLSNWRFLAFLDILHIHVHIPPPHQRLPATQFRALLEIDAASTGLVPYRGTCCSRRFAATFALRLGGA